MQQHEVARITSSKNYVTYELLLLHGDMTDNLPFVH
jgi:hypothetical protein